MPVAEVALPGPSRMVLMHRPGCHLCDDARRALALVRDATGVDWHEVDIGRDPLLLQQYGDLVPVLLVDGRQHSRWHIDPGALAADLLRT